MPAKYTVTRWLQADAEFSERYALARLQAADAMAEQLQDLADKALQRPEEANAIRVAADILKWTASKLKPGSYGDRITQHVIDETPKSPDDVQARITFLEAELSELLKAREGKEEVGEIGIVGAQPQSVPTTRSPDLH